MGQEFENLDFQSKHRFRHTLLLLQKVYLVNNLILLMVRDLKVRVKQYNQ